MQLFYWHKFQVWSGAQLWKGSLDHELGNQLFSQSQRFPFIQFYRLVFHSFWTSDLSFTHITNALVSNAALADAGLHRRVTGRYFILAAHSLQWCQLENQGCSTEVKWYSRCRSMKEPRMCETSGHQERYSDE
jgi:hypothetical protein